MSEPLVSDLPSPSSRRHGTLNAYKLTQCFWVSFICGLLIFLPELIDIPKAQSEHLTLLVDLSRGFGQKLIGVVAILVISSMWVFAKGSIERMFLFLGICIGCATSNLITLDMHLAALADCSPLEQWLSLPILGSFGVLLPAAILRLLIVLLGFAKRASQKGSLR